MSASAILHAHIGAPPHDDCGRLPCPAPCWICGSIAARGTPVATFVGKSMTDQNTARAPSSQWVCEPCVYVRARFSPVPGRPPKDGKEQGGRFTNYSHLYDADERPQYVNASKGEKPAILAFLRRQHAGTWFAAIADSGQKHVLPYAPVNPAGSRGRVRFEEATIALPPVDGWQIVDDLVALLTAGATKEEVGRGDYTARAWSICAERIRAFEGQHGSKRGSDWFRLALWLGQRDEEAVASRMATEKETKAAAIRVAKESKRGKAERSGEGKATNANGRGVARVTKRVPASRGVATETLGSDPVADAGGRANEREPRGVDHEARTELAVVRQGQLGFPSFG